MKPRPLPRRSSWPFGMDLRPMPIKLLSLVRLIAPLTSTRPFSAVCLSQSTSSCQYVPCCYQREPHTFSPLLIALMWVYLALQDAVQRESILRVLLHDENLAQDVDIQALAALTTDFSGSDLEELCRNVAMRALRAALHSGNATAAPDDIELAPLCMADFVACLGQVKHAHTENQPTPFGASELSAESLD
eukprot:m.122383 g.122383  ORF g.122383 m.122383 type:complete len:190 (+) comp9626_c0_seq2:1851-2420(+)